ncbi:MAG: hypothetical protein PVJ57_22215 [Phycisphaerae bacterium]
MLCGLAALTAGTLLGACTSSSGTIGPGASGTTASAMQHPMLEGIPIPSGFSLVDDRSFGWKTGTLRTANCEFAGSTGVAEVNRFYREYMPSAGFTLRQERFDRGEYVMEFDSTNERSTVRIRRESFKTILIVDVSPTPRGSAERDVKPPTRRP